MRNVNKFLVLFIIVILGLFAGIVNFIQSSYFGSIISNQVNSRIASMTDAQVDIEKITFSLLPLQTNLVNVKAELPDKVVAHLGNLAVELSFWDLFRSDLRISKIILDNGYVKINEDLNKTSREESVEDVINPFLIINKTILPRLPFGLGEFEITNVDIFTNNRKIPVHEFNLKLYQSSIDYEFIISNLHIDNFEIDQVKIRGEFLEEKIRLTEAYIAKNTAEIKMIGEVLLQKNYPLNIEIDYGGDIGEFVFGTDIQQYLQSGIASCLISVEGEAKNPSVKFRGKLERFRNIYAEVDELDFRGSYFKNNILIDKLNVQKGKGTARVNNNISIDLATGKVSDINASVKEMHSHDLLYFLGPDFKVLKTNISSDVNLSIDKDVIKITATSPVILKDVRVGESEDILNIKKIELPEFFLETGDNVKLKASGLINASPVSVKGEIGDSLSIKLSAQNLNLLELGGELGSTAQGTGDIDALFEGTSPDVNLYVKSKKIKELSVLGYHVPDEVSASLKYSFEKEVITISNIKSLNSNILGIVGSVDLDKEELDVLIASNKIQIQGLRNIITPVWNDVKEVTQYFDGLISGKSRLSGSFKNLKIDNSFKSEKFSILNETLKSISFDLAIDEDNLKLSNVRLLRDNGNLSGKFFLNFKKGIELIDFDIEGMNLNDFLFYRKLGLGYDGSLNGEIKLEKAKSGYRGGGQVLLLGSSVGRKKIKPSSIMFSIDNHELISSGTLLGSRIKFDSKVFFGERSKEYSKFNTTADITDLRLLLGILSLHNIYDSELAGEFKGQLTIGARLDNLKNVDAKVSLNKFFLRKFNKEIKLSEDSENIIDISKSKIDKMGIRFEGNGGHYQLNGSGDFNKIVKLEEKFRFDLTFLHLLSDKVERASGSLSGKGIFTGKVGEFENSHEIDANDLTIFIKDVPVSLNNVEMRSILTSNSWELKDLNGYLGGGKLFGRGRVGFKIPYPVLNLTIRLDDVTYPFAENSRANIGGVFDLVGSQFPYSLRGNAIINSGIVEDEFTAFTGSSGYLKSIDKYIDIQKRGLPDIIKLNVSASTKDNIHVKNRLSDILLKASGTVKGNPMAPDVKAVLNVVPAFSKFKFKGNEFIINEGVVTYDVNSNTNLLNVNFTSEAKIAQYDIKMDVVGSEEDLKINMESNPSLSKEDIFSLLALGVTSDFTKNLEEKDRASLTTIGLGTLIVDQLKINDGLDATLGLKLSVLPEISESDDTPIQASKNESGTRGKTATKLKIQKKVTENVGITFSNTFGNEEGQKQEMNIDLNLNDNWSIQGVFETGTGTSNDNKEGDGGSVGADVKYRWSY
ncbi:translocation/assembly module TamB domain-containing protein [Bacteriovorax sp. Seq25_V]|uniref:translocation/assembly module TamB domain-containing protein n=1 Tax=Bacteriovorax sp. Seq25_V TaxID=1201288 RepID=UPI00038A1B6F|nr:translocation/assembly module TamB domain-containing protein [Bacteriovorax sp. Seq25_V]EQC43320.1 PF04357 family protein [Bacteriovorax sp. Seq25_V]